VVGGARASGERRVWRIRMILLFGKERERVEREGSSMHVVWIPYYLLF
jgi:hypothetical protein